MHAHHQQQSKLKKKKCSIIPIISILCVIVSSVNIFLIANILLLEKNTMVGMTNNGISTSRILVDQYKEKEYEQQAVTRRTATTFNP